MILTNVMIVTLVYLVVLSFIDLKFKTIPSILTWSFMIVTLAMGGPSSLYGGVFMLLIGLFLMDYSETVNFFEGGQDIKALVAIGFTLQSQLAIFLFIPILLAIGLLYKVAMKYGLKKPDTYEVAFMPVFLVAYTIFCVGVNLWL